ncbi:hypothetical protein [Amaricoccus tamworthensis]|uniref:hypothetical protein n=1 Tax=Amaricoccus tamworthensis TaxID=57002 RepID=UPI003C7ACEBC
MLNFDRQLFVPLCTLVLLSETGAGFAESNPPIIDDPSEEDCSQVEKKNATGETLTPTEGDLLYACLFPSVPYDFNDDVEGWEAYQAPQDLFEMEEFKDIPGILGNSERQS